MGKANFYSSMICKPGLKVVSLPMYIASYTMIDMEYAESFGINYLDKQVPKIYWFDYQ